MRTFRSLAALAVIVGCGLALPAPATAGVTAVKPVVTAAERAAAIVAPAMVNIEVTWQGYVRHKITGALVNDQSITVTSHCGGFGVSSDGYLVTAGQCVDPASVALAFFQQVADRQVAQGVATRDQAAMLFSDLVINGTIVGQPVDAPPKRTVTVRRGVTPDDQLTATVVSIAPPIAGDVAVLKIEKNNQPLVRLVSVGDVKAGLEVLTVEYPAGSDPTARPTARTGSIAQTEPVLLANAGPTDPLPGAPVLTLDGELAGVLSRHQSALATDLLAPVAAISAELQTNKVSNQLSQLDVDYREGLDAYYAGRYTESIEKFDAVLAIVPSHSQAHDFREQAQTLRDAEGGGQDPDMGLVATVTGWFNGALGPLAAAAVLVGLALVLVRRRGHKADPAPPVAAAVAPTAARARPTTPDYCPNCSNALPPAAAECPNCGGVPRTGELSEKARPPGESAEESRPTHR
jgi:serine protease Do